jgi:hypothetical protein
MSVDYKSALIYGYDCDPANWSYEETEALEILGWDIIRDCYNDEFLYIGIKLSCVDCYEEAKVDVFKALNPSMLKFSELLNKTPERYKVKLPLSGSVYHLCYAT